MIPTSARRRAYSTKAPEAMATIPAASPSRPSMRLTALASPTTHSTVMSSDHPDDRITRSKNGTLNTSIETPAAWRTTPATAVPAALARGDSPLVSSASPTPKMVPSARTPPRISPRDDRSPMNSPTAAAARIPAIIAMPPATGVGLSWTWRTPGSEAAPHLTASLAVSGTNANVTAAATAATMTNDTNCGISAVHGNRGRCPGGRIGETAAVWALHARRRRDRLRSSREGLIGPQ